MNKPSPTHIPKSHHLEFKLKGKWVKGPEMDESEPMSLWLEVGKLMAIDKGCNQARVVATLEDGTWFVPFIWSSARGWFNNGRTE
ncbi:hypothetical protein EYS42_08835 [Aquabacterium lacunae]|uniref:Uncharacterized protein n=1 Tax=Aquabacterium lacunae TaxID=2528630 RepID=A0A4Q9GZ96_9BURK|nr:hypothetical protein [Aquabacterium lacunae]TBO31340.1 hypothetical protein EYS42_08835 [Aquabacterium lacunae]